MLRFFFSTRPAFVLEKMSLKEEAEKISTSVKAAAAEVEGSGEGGEEQKETEGEGGEQEKKKKKRIGFHDRKVCIVYLVSF